MPTLLPLSQRQLLPINVSTWKILSAVATAPSGRARLVDIPWAPERLFRRRGIHCRLAGSIDSPSRVHSYTVNSIVAWYGTLVFTKTTTSCAQQLSVLKLVGMLNLKISRHISKEWSHIWPRGSMPSLPSPQWCTWRPCSLLRSWGWKCLTLKYISHRH